MRRVASELRPEYGSDAVGRHRRLSRPAAPPMVQVRCAACSAHATGSCLASCPAALLVTGGFAAIFIQSQNQLSNVSLTYGAFFLALCVAAHLVVRFSLPHADPYLFPLAAALASVGIVMLYRIDPTLARQQAQWFVVGLVLFAAAIVLAPRAAAMRCSSATATRSPWSGSSACCCRGCRASASRSTAPI